MTSPWQHGKAAEKSRNAKRAADDYQALRLILGEYAPETKAEGEEVCFRAALVAMMVVASMADTIGADMSSEDYDATYAASLMTVISYCASLAPEAVKDRKRAPISRGFITRFSRFMIEEMRRVKAEIKAAAE